MQKSIFPGHSEAEQAIDPGRVPFHLETGDLDLDREGREAARGDLGHLRREATLTGRLQDPSAAFEHDMAVIQWSRIATRGSGFSAKRWILDPGPAFEKPAVIEEVRRKGRFPESLLREYAKAARRFSRYGSLVAVRAPDFPWTLRDTESRKNFSPGLAVADHQRVSTEAYLRLAVFVDGYAGVDEPLPETRENPLYVMPTLTGEHGLDYLEHLQAYEREIPDGLPAGAWIAVGHRERRGRVVAAMEDLLGYRTDLRLHLPAVQDLALAQGSAWIRAYTLDLAFIWSQEVRGVRDQNNQTELARATLEKSSRPRSGTFTLQDCFLTRE